MTRPFRLPTNLQSTKEPVLSAAVSGRHNRNRVSIIRSDIRVSERSEDGCPCRSEDNTDPLFSVLAIPS